MKALFLFLALLLLTEQSQALELGRNLPQSARDVEFFYQHKEIASLPGILRTFDKKKRFQSGEIRLIIAAFLSEISRREKECAEEIFARAAEFSPDGQRMLLWAAHLADLPQKVLGKDLPAQENTALLRQIERSPHKVLEWDPLASRTIAQMYLGAFFAYADMRYIDALLDTTKLFSRLQKEGRIQDPLYARAQSVAALLYEMAQRHPCVRKHIEARRKKLSGLDASLLDKILASD